MPKRSSQVLLVCYQAILILVCCYEECANVLLLEPSELTADFRSVNEPVLVEIECDEVVFVLLLACFVLNRGDRAEQQISILTSLTS